MKKIVQASSLIFCVAVFTANGQDIVVPAENSYTVTSDRSVNSVTVNGQLLIDPEVTLTVGNNFMTGPGGIVSLSTKSVLNVQATLTIESGGLLVTSQNTEVNAGMLTLNSGRMIINSTSTVEADEAAWNGSAEVSVNEYSILTIHGNLATQGPVRCSMSATSEIGFHGNTTLENVDNMRFEWGRLSFSGQNNQVLTSPKLIADNVVLGGGTLRLVVSDTVQIRKKLVLSSGRLVSDRPVKVISTDVMAIERSTGYVIAPSLIRNVDKEDVYTFPLGTLSRICAAQIYPLSAGQGAVAVEVHHGAANNLSERPSQITAVNDAYYHTIYKTGAVDEVDVVVYHSSSLGSYNRVLNYNAQALAWGMLSPFSGSLSLAPNLQGASGRKVKLYEYNGLNPGVNLFVMAGTEAPSAEASGYAVLHKKLDGGYLWIPDGILRFQFEEEYAEDDDELNWKIYDARHVVRHDSRSFPVSYGDNRYEIDIRSLVSQGFGVLEVINNKNEKWYLRFKAGSF